MNTDDLKKLKEEYPDAMNVWYDRVFELSKGQLIETLLTHMTPTELGAYLGVIQEDIKTERKLEE